MLVTIILTYQPTEINVYLSRGGIGNSSLLEIKKDRFTILPFHPVLNRVNQPIGQDFDAVGKLRLMTEGKN